MTDVARLFEEHHASLYRYAVRLCGDPDLAADAAQEAFVRALGQHRGAALTRGWLFTVATNYVLERRRTSTRRERLVAHAEARAPMADPPRDPHDAVVALERQELVRQALDALSDKERVALLMREDGFTHREIAQAVNTTTGSVGTLIARALDHLADALDLDREYL